MNEKQTVEICAPQALIRLRARSLVWLISFRPLSWHLLTAKGFVGLILEKEIARRRFQKPWLELNKSVAKSRPSREKSIDKQASKVINSISNDTPYNNAPETKLFMAYLNTKSLEEPQVYRSKKRDNN
mmetsp:Transcript_12104/g.12106  ORF Transcript_12104/g.12106 Transcript_12104/m.12106 type:complete len:128 (+) Transcript_12104:274-657(+)